MNGPWFINNEHRNKSLPLYEKLDKEEALNMKSKIAEWSNLKHTHAKLAQEDPLLNKTQMDEILERMNKINNETDALGTLILRRCMRLTQEEIDDMKLTEYHSLVHAIINFSLTDDDTYVSPR
ncbi:MAG: hypothetical protein ABI361_00365 [Nitrososphaera sp.]